MFNSMKYFRRVLIALLLVALPLNAWSKEVDPFDSNRARLLGHMLQQQLSSKHYSQKPMDDALSEAAFDLYLKQLDFQKRFLLQKDVAELTEYRDQIDDAIRRGRLELPIKGRELLNQRINQVSAMLDELLKQKIDPKVKESIESDPKKLDFAADLTELRNRWRKVLKFQILNRYISLREDDIGTDDSGALLPVDEKTDRELLEKAREKVGKTTRNLLERMLEESLQDHYDRYLNAIARAYDPHTSYMPPTSKEDFDIQMSGSLEGIGATLREEDGYIKVVRVIPGSAAAKQGQLEADDIILKVAEGAEEPVDITDTRIRDAVALIRGKKGTEVRLTVKKPDGRQLTIPIIRDVVEIEETFVKGTTISDPDGKGKVGYVKIPSFYRDYSGKTDRNVTDDLREELDKLNTEHITSLILDLRNNGGGSLSDAVSVTGLFIPTGPVVQIRDGQGDIRVMSDDDRSVAYSGPMIVLVNRFSASASEILAGALQDYDRALIVGDEHTHGKGTVQALLDLDRFVNLRGMDKYMPLGAIKVTIQKFYRISGESTQEKGVTPDVVLPSRLDGLESGEKYLDNALPWDHIAPVKYSLWVPPVDHLDLLRQQSHARIENSKDFQEIISETVSAKKRREHTRQSLLLKDLLTERRELRQEEKNGPHFGMMSEPEEDVPQEDLDKQIADDPYVKEGIHLLDDMQGFAS
ncbi:carboxy terminal-processing peptidase [Pelobacter seleniigenes]|uniref:carboxy terminal-processing peptidase n=1 Tax=Pelobacter seleniigenes TaxID=407188 RepID=UPI0004A749DD|nr:carboxy terminal-processing peptidase [Pelobacter seleniigenes]